MIWLDKVNLRIGRNRLLLDRCSFAFEEGMRCSVIAPSTRAAGLFVDLLTGNIRPQAGRVIRHGSLSWNLNKPPLFGLGYSGREMVTFYAGIYAKSAKQVEHVLREDYGIAADFDKNLGKWNRVERRAFFLALPFALDFNILIFESELLTRYPKIDQTLRPILTARSEIGLVQIIDRPDIIDPVCTQHFQIENGKIVEFQKQQTGQDGNPEVQSA